MASHGFMYGPKDRALSGEPQITEKRPIILKECARCHVLVDRETLFKSLCPWCAHDNRPDPNPKEITHGG